MKQIPYFYLTRTNGLWEYVSPFGRTVCTLEKGIELLTK